MSAWWPKGNSTASSGNTPASALMLISSTFGLGTFLLGFLLTIIILWSTLFG